MANTLPTIRNLGVYGLIRPAAVDDVLIPEGAVTEVLNFHFDRAGVPIVRPGMTNLGGTSIAGVGGLLYQSELKCIGLHNYQSSTLIAAFNDTRGSIILYLLGAGQQAWGTFQVIPGSPNTSIGGTASTAKVRFANFSSGVAMAYGTGQSQAVNFIFNSDRVADISGYGSLGLTLFPSSDVDVVATSNLNEVYKSRLYLAGTTNHASRLYFSSVIDTNGIVTWTPTTDYVDINPGDGESITSLKRYSLELVVFKPNYMYRFRTSGLDPDPLIKIGTRSHESVVEGKRGLYFHNENGFFRYSGSYPTEISKPIIDIVQSIPTSQYSNIVGWRDYDHIYWSIGNVTINQNLTDTPSGTVWKNVVLRYTESSDLWTIYSYPSEVRRAVSYVTNLGSSMSIALGLDNGSVSVFNAGTTDIGEPIAYRLITKWYEWGGIAYTKSIEYLITLCEKGEDMQLFCQMDDKPEWQAIGQLRKFVNLFRGPQKFKRVRFKVSGSSRFEGPMFRGIEVLKFIEDGLLEQI